MDPIRASNGHAPCCFKVVLPNFILIAFAVFAVRTGPWARALRASWIDLREDVEHRSPRDLSAIDLAGFTRGGSSAGAVIESPVWPGQCPGRWPTAVRGRRGASTANAIGRLAGAGGSVGAGRQRGRAGGAAPSGARASVMLRAEQIQQACATPPGVPRSLANQLLALSSADARAMHSQPMQRVDLKQMCEVILESHLDAATAKPLIWVWKASPQFVMGHEWLLRELLGNVVSNASQVHARRKVAASPSDLACVESGAVAGGGR
jgi:two-component system sensor histidine kinase TctE